MSKSQWDCVLQNLGQWHVSFTRFSPRAEPAFTLFNPDQPNCSPTNWNAASAAQSLS